MFNNKPEDETDFCESYKSQILGVTPSEKKNSLFITIVKLLTILILLIVITGVSFYGYNYFRSSQKFKNTVLPPVSMQVSDDEALFDDNLVVEAEDIEEIKVEKVLEEKNISFPLVVSPQVEEKEIDKIANDIKIAIAKSEEKEENKTKIELNHTKSESSLEVPTLAAEAKYLEELADLSKEIDKERNP